MPKRSHIPLDLSKKTFTKQNLSNNHAFIPLDLSLPKKSNLIHGSVLMPIDLSLPKIRVKQKLTYNRALTPLDLSLPRTLKDAILKRDYASVKRLLKNGADPNAQDNEGFTSLHLATKDNRLYIIRLLLQYGASILIKDNMGCTALDYTFKFNRPILQSFFEKKLTRMDSRNAFNLFTFDNKALTLLENESIENNINQPNLR